MSPIRPVRMIRHRGYAVTVTATLADGLKWGTMPPAWTYVDNDDGDVRVTLNAASCDEVTPVAPTVTQAVCRDGVLVPPTVTLATTDGITYTADQDGAVCAVAGVVTVTATLDDDGVGWPAAAGGVDRDGSDDGDVHGAVRVTRRVFPVVPVDPMVTQATCTAGEVTVPTIELATTSGGGHLCRSIRPVRMTRAPTITR